MRRIISVAAATAFIGVAAFVGATIGQVSSSPPAFGSPALPCTESSAQLPLGLAHGNPQTGLQPSPGVDDYYYEFVSPNSNCPAGKTFKMVATFQVQNVLSGVGKLPGRPTTSADTQEWWITFHSGTGSSGSSISLDNNKGVTQTGGTPVKCKTTFNAGTVTCLKFSGTQPITLTYVGSPSVFKGSYGVKYTNLGTLVETDISQLSIVG